MAVIIELYATGTLLMTTAAQKHTTLDPGVSPGEPAISLEEGWISPLTGKIKLRVVFPVQKSKKAAL